MNRCEKLLRERFITAVQGKDWTWFRTAVYEDIYTPQPQFFSIQPASSLISISVALLALSPSSDPPFRCRRAYTPLYSTTTSSPIFSSPLSPPPSAADLPMEEDKTPWKMADAFKELASALNQCPDGEEHRLELCPFSHACSLVPPLFRCLGIAFKFAELNYVAKVHDLEEALSLMMEDDVKIRLREEGREPHEEFIENEVWN